MTRSAYISHEHKLVVFWSQKAACTSITDRFIFEILGKQRETLGDDPRRWLYKHGYYFPWQEALRIVKKNGYKSIAMYRPPYERLVSCFIDKFCIRRQEILDQFDKLEHFAQDFYVTIHGEYSAPYKGLTFHDFVENISLYIRRRRSNEPDLDQHWNTQGPFRFLKIGFEYDYVYDTNNSDRYFQKLSELVGKNVPNAHVNRSFQSKDISTIDDLVNTPTIEFINDLKRIKKEAFFDQNLKSLVENDFAPDQYYLNRAQEFMSKESARADSDHSGS